MSDNKRPPSGAKVVWGFGIFLKHLRSYITASRFIPTESKDRLIESLEKSHRQLKDAEKRANGNVPPTPKQEREWNGNIKKLKKS